MTSFPFPFEERHNLTPLPPEIEKMTILKLLFLSEISILYLGFCSGLSSSNKVAKTTITVCTGPDCRVDGASDCLRQLQKSVAANHAPIRVTGRNCIGPCGDGPCVMVLNAENEKVVEKQDSKVTISLAPPDLFASDPKGWYQVRTGKQVDEVMEIACKSANVPYETSVNESSGDELIVQPTRQIYDRPATKRVESLAAAHASDGIGRVLWYRQAW